MLRNPERSGVSISVQEVRSIQRIPLHGPEPSVANNVPQLFFCSAIVYACGSHDVFFEHH